MRPFMIEATNYNTPSLLNDWQWLLPKDHTPLFISVMGDWVFVAPDGSIWNLSILDGSYLKIAATSEEYNNLKKSSDWLDKTFAASWQGIAEGQGLSPEKDQCLGWNVHPLRGGKLDKANLKIFSMLIYQSLMGQLHEQIQPKDKRQKKPWFKLW